MENMFDGFSKEVQVLRNKKYIVRPIRRKGGWVNEDHDSAFMNDGSIRSYPVPSQERGRVLVNPCVYASGKPWSKDDMAALAEELGLENVHDLNPNAPKGFWRREAESTVRLDRNGKHLDLTQTRDFIEFLVLRSNSHLIASSWATRFDDGEFKFALVEEGEELEDSVSNLEEKKRAYRELDKIDGSTQRMEDFLYVYYLTKKDAKKPPRGAKENTLKGIIGDIIDNDLDVFLSIIEDKNYTLKLLIQRSVEVGALEKRGHTYTLRGADEPIGVLEDLLVYLDDPKNQTERVKLMHFVEDKVEQ